MNNRLIATCSVESNFTPYEVELYEGFAEVFVLKSKAWGNGGFTYRTRIKTGSATHKRVLRDLRQRTDPGSLTAENLNNCAATR